MTQFVVKKATEMPQSRGASLANAIRALDGTKAIFIGVEDGTTLETTRARASSAAYPAGAKVRTDREANGVWIYRS